MLEGTFELTILLFFILLNISLIIILVKLNKKYNRSIRESLYIDRITKLWNVDKFIIESYKLLSAKVTLPYSIVSVNINKFRYVIETHGYAFGDKILQEVAREFLKSLPKSAISARYTADRFIILLPFNTTNEIYCVLNKLYDTLESIKVNNFDIKLSFNTGVYIFRKNDKLQSTKDIYKYIDKAELARMKITGDYRNQIMFFEDLMHADFLNEKFIEENLESALQSKEFIVYYQPKFDIATNQVVGAEALVRWNSKKLGFLSPNDFIPFLEKTNNIIELDFYVLNEVCKLIRFWLDNNYKPLPISINQSRNHMTSEDYFDRINAVLVRYNIPKDLIEFEITERVFLDNSNAADFMNKMHNLGYQVSMDDFGSGFSSLNLLNQIDIKILKLDKCFLSDKADDKKSKIILKSIVQMAEYLDLAVICEGVESNWQEELLRDIGCNYVQGYYYDKPMPEKDFVEKYIFAI